MTRDQMDKLQRAALQIAEVQAELLFEDEKLPVPEQNDEHWRRLYRIHTQLGELHGLDERLGGLGRGDFRMAKKSKEDAINELGELIDKLDNYNHALLLPMPADFHVKQFKESLPGLVKDFKKAFTSVTGENPWSTYPNA